MMPSVPAAIITGMMASPSSPSVRFTALAAPTITIIAKGMKKKLRLIRSTSLKSGMASWLVRGPPDGAQAAQKSAGNRGNQRSPSPSRTRPETPLGVVLRNLGIVVGKPDQRQSPSVTKQHDPDIWAVEPGPEERRDDQRREDQEAAHGGGAGLGGQMAFGAVLADRLTVLLAAAEEVDERLAEDEPKNERGEERRPCPERDVPKEVEEVAAVRKIREPVQQGPSPLHHRWFLLPERADGIGHEAHPDALRPFHKDDITCLDKAMRHVGEFFSTGRALTALLVRYG